MLSIQIPFNKLVLPPFGQFTITEVEIVKSPVAIRKKLLALTESKKKIGFVPTMGALHQGHESLVKRAVSENDITVVSIFVNPAQFNNPADFEKYPNNFENDVAQLRQLGCDYVFAPDTAEMYPQKPRVSISVPELQQQMEGRFRPGHFEGVSLVVAKLFHFVPARRVYFGQKDWQQYLIVRQLVTELAFDVEIVWVPTVRETDGLALSSRNLRLSSEGRKKAATLYQLLRMAQAELKNGAAVKTVKNMVQEAALQSGCADLEYFEVADRETLKPVERVEGDGATVSLFIAGYVEGIRLIDNIFLTE